MFFQSNALNIHIKRASEDDMRWVNESYDAIKFQKSDFNNEIIAIAMNGKERVGVGRLVKLQGNAYELGGMYVYRAYRKHGIASKIIDFLLNQVAEDCTIYCLPFKHLSAFYKKFGFKELVANENIPEKIALKYQWCNQAYEYEVGCLIIKPCSTKKF